MIIVLRQRQTMQAHHAHNIVESGALDGGLQACRHLGVGNLQPTRQPVGHVAAVKGDALIAVAVVIDATHLATDGHLVAYLAAGVEIGGQQSQLIVVGKFADVYSVCYYIDCQMFVGLCLKFYFSVANVRSHAGIGGERALGVATETPFYGDVS